MKLFEKIKAFFKRPTVTIEKNIVRTAIPAGPEPSTPQPKPTEFHRDWRAIERANEIERIRQANQNRRQKFSNSEHFKQRQPTTSRKLWNPNAKLPTDEDD